MGDPISAAGATPQPIGGPAEGGLERAGKLTEKQKLGAAVGIIMGSGKANAASEASSAPDHNVRAWSADVRVLELTDKIQEAATHSGQDIEEFLGELLADETPAFQAQVGALIDEGMSILESGDDTIEMLEADENGSIPETPRTIATRAQALNGAQGTNGVYGSVNLPGTPRENEYDPIPNELKDPDQTHHDLLEQIRAFNPDGAIIHQDDQEKNR
jgi:hypothetical protein